MWVPSTLRAALRHGRANAPIISQQSLSGFSSTPCRHRKITGNPGPPPIRVEETENDGRGVFATRDICAGELIHTAKPVVSYPAFSAIGTVCYSCLKKLSPSQSCGGKPFVFCSQKCADEAKINGIEVPTSCKATGLHGCIRSSACGHPIHTSTSHLVSRDGFRDEEGLRIAEQQPREVRIHRRAKIIGTTTRSRGSALIPSGSSWRQDRTTISYRRRPPAWMAESPSAAPSTSSRRCTTTTAVRYRTSSIPVKIGTPILFLGGRSKRAHCMDRERRCEDEGSARC